MASFGGAYSALTARGGVDRNTPSAGASPEPTLFLAGEGALTVVDVNAQTAEVHPLAELAPGDAPYRVVRRTNELVIYGGDTYVVDSSLHSSPRKLGDSWFFIPSARSDRVWLAVLDETSPETVRDLSAVREVSIDGRVTFPAVHPPGGRWPLAAVGEELVFEDRQGGLELWNPATREFTRSLPGASLGPTQGDLLAWCERDGRVLHVLDVATGRDLTVVPPQGFGAFDCWSGAFAPDNSSLAIAVSAGGNEAERSLALVDLADGATRAVDGSGVDPPYVFVAWSSAGDRVFVSGGERYARRSKLSASSSGCVRPHGEPSSALCGTAHR